ncbi:hypothetical protein D3C81_290420 [compost metagenome]
MPALSTVGELMGPRCQLWPIEVLMLSVPPMLRLWQLLQEIKPERDRRGSKNNFLPSSTIAGWATLAAAMGWIGSRSAACTMAPKARLVMKSKGERVRRMVYS